MHNNKKTTKGKAAPSIGKAGAERKDAAKPMPPNRIATQARVCAQMTLTALAETLRGRHPADHTLRTITSENHQLGARDRRIISETLFSTLRWWGWLKKLAPAALEAVPEGESAPPLHSSDWYGVFAAAWILENRFELPPSVMFWLREAKLNPELFQGISTDTPVAERRRHLRPFFQDRPMPSLTVEELLPAWVQQQLSSAEGDEASVDLRKLAEWNQRRAPVWLRAQIKDLDRLKGTVEKESDYAVKLLPHDHLAGAFAVRHVSANLKGLPSFQEGAFEIQDLASQCVAFICAPKPGEQWWDTCAGGGGKSLHLGLMMQNRGAILSTDIRASKLEELKLRARRAHLSNLRTKVWGGSGAAESNARFDGVLVDAPCSCSGTWRRAPEGRWNTLPEDVERYAAIQCRLLESAATGVRPGGVLVYSTCSMLPAENRRIVQAFLEKHTDFSLEPSVNPLNGEATDGTLQIWPWDGDCDAMYTAKFRRRK